MLYCVRKLKQKENNLMKIRFIRHGDPDYVNDTLTEKGRKEAELLAKAAGRLGPVSYTHLTLPTNSLV